MIDCNITENYLREKARMIDGCHIGCGKCPFDPNNNGTGTHCSLLESVHPKKAIEIVQKWSDEHPKKTFLSDFLEKYPNALMDEDGTPLMCPFELGYCEEPDDCENRTCSACWNQPLEK